MGKKTKVLLEGIEEIIKKEVEEIKWGIREGYLGELEPEIIERIQYSAEKARYISGVSKDGIAIVCFPDYEDLASFTESGLRFKKINNIRRKTLEESLKKFEIDKKNLKEMVERDVFTLAYFDEPTLKEIMDYGMMLVKKGRVKSFHYFNVDPEKLEETTYAVGHVDKPTLKKIIKSGIELVKEGRANIFRYFNLIPGLDKKVKYTIDPERLEKAEKYREKVKESVSSTY
jgi:hypothetical protein